MAEHHSCTSNSCEADLMTPISSSSADSPTMHQYGRRLMGTSLDDYSAPASPNGQVPTPPGSSRAYGHWNHPSFEMNSHPNDTSSPMHASSHAGADYYAASWQTPMSSSLYLGSFAVSDSHAAPVSHAESPYYAMPMPDHTQMDHRAAAHHMHMPQHPPRDLGCQVTMPMPPLQDVQRGPLYGAPVGRRNSPIVPVKEEQQPSFQTISPPNASPLVSSEVLGNSRIKKRTSRKKSPKSLDSVKDRLKDCYGREDPPLIKDNCPEEYRLVLESYWVHRHRKGTDLWDRVAHDCRHVLPGKKNEALQMQYRRGRGKFYAWKALDEVYLREACLSVLRDIHKVVREKFLELGGSQNMGLNAIDIKEKMRLDEDCAAFLREKSMGVILDLWDEEDREKKNASARNQGGSDK